MSDDPQTLCSECGSLTLRRVILSSPHVSVKNFDTIGKLADKNWKDMGHYEREDKLMKDKVPELIEKKKKRERINKIAKMTPEEKNRWIINGD
jgi:hypothetical protein